jgi:large repetitive protein
MRRTDRARELKHRRLNHRGWSCGRRAALAALAALLGLGAGGMGSPLLAQGTITACDAAAAPAAGFSASCSGLTCTFTVTSPPPAGADFAWDFGDGNSPHGPATSISHVYMAAGSYVVTLTVTDGNGQVAIASATVTVGASTLPLAADDAFVTAQDTPITINVQELLANDAPGVTFVQADPAKCYVAAGAVSCTYTPPSGFTGVDSFTYSVRDAAGNTGSATVRITVRRQLVANPDYFTVNAGSSIQISSTQLLANDTPGAVFVSAQNPVNGTLTLSSAGPPAVYTFTPASGFTGDGTFDYLISWDGKPPYERGFVTVTVTDAPPIAQFTTYCVSMTCQVHTTSYDPDGTAITRYLWDWGDGTPVVQPGPPVPWADQSHTYAVSGRYTITHTVYDTAGLSGSLQLSVVANATPVAGNDTASTDRDVPVTIDVLANDSDPDGDVLTPGNVDLRTYYPGASWQVVQVNGRWEMKVTPPDSFVGTMTFHYQACDNLGACSAPATITLTVKQWTVIIDAIGEQFYVPQNGSLRIPLATLLANDYDSKGDPLTIIAFDTSILMGTLDCTTDPTTCVYRPPLNGGGYTLFRYTITDPAGHHSTTTVRIYVGVVPPPPTAADIYWITTAPSGKAFTIQDVWQSTFDQDGNTLAIVVPRGPVAYGWLACTAPMYSCTYTPNPGFVGTDRFIYTASDGINPPVSAYINVLTLPNPTPTFDAREDLVVTGINQPAYISYPFLTSNDYDPSGYPITVTAIDTTGLNGSLACDGYYSCTYTPPGWFQGATAFRYTASNGHGATDTAVVKINVGVTDPPPVIAAQAGTIPRNTPIRFSVFDLLRNSYDPSNDPLNVTVYAFTAHLGTLACGNPNYWCTYTPNANATGADVINFAVSNGAAYTNSTVTINIQ